MEIGEKARCKAAGGGAKDNREEHELIDREGNMERVETGERGQV